MFVTGRAQSIQLLECNDERRVKEMENNKKIRIQKKGNTIEKRRPKSMDLIPVATRTNHSFRI